MAIHVFGIRHHGPGSARSLVRALDRLAPDIVLIEGPPEAESVLPLVQHDGMKPPVALLGYVPDNPARSVFYPFAEFSPEWQAIRHGMAREVPVRFIDLPLTHVLADPAETPPTAAVAVSEPAAVAETEAEADAEAEPNSAQAIRRDPLGYAGRLAGYADGERWWEHLVETRRDDTSLFAAVLDLMTALREGDAVPPDAAEARREAHMRQAIRAAHREGFGQIAVVCGAWHAPVLGIDPSARDTDLALARADAERLKGLPKVKIAVTWIPWTYGRLSLDSGYGAGIDAPGWYAHLWNASESASPDARTVTIGWLTQVAHALRAADLSASSAQIIDAVRLAEATATLRDRPIPGLAEMMEATRAVLTRGSDAPMALIHEQVIVGERLGSVPEATPLTPLQHDLQRQQRSLRLAPEAAFRDLDLDLRKPNDLARSHLLHRLLVLGVNWGRLAPSHGAPETFHERWRVQWHPELEVPLIEAGIWGTTLLDAALHRLQDAADRAQALPVLTQLIHQAMLAEVPAAARSAMQRLADLAAVTSDMPHLMAALPPLADVARYGSVRRTDTELVRSVIDALITRIALGLPLAVSTLNDEGAREMLGGMMGVHGVIERLQDEDHRRLWLDALDRITDLPTGHGLISGRASRMLFDAERWSAEALARRLSLGLAGANPPTEAAAWVEGLLGDSGLVLIHHDALWSLLDGWVSGLSGETFLQVLPLLRRTFSAFDAAERRRLGERVRAGGPGVAAAATASMEAVDTERAQRVLPIVAMLLGWTEE